MKSNRCLLTLAMLATVAGVANARNVITEWGLHDPNDYRVFSQAYPPYDDLYVVIKGNSEPDKVWKFKAWNNVEDVPGFINNIRIQDGPTVTGIRLSVIGQPPPFIGAAELKSLDITTNGDGTNILDEIDVVFNVGEIGPLWANAAGTLTIGDGSVACGLRTCGVRAPEPMGLRPALEALAAR